MAITKKKAAVKKPAKKKLVLKKKPVQKKKALVKKSTAVLKPKLKKPVKAGKVIHFYNHIKVAILKLSLPLSIGQKLEFKGATTDFVQEVKSMQIDHEAIKKAAKGKIIGLKVSKRVREGDLAYLV